MSPRARRTNLAANKGSLEPLARLSLLAAASSGLLLVLAFPKFNLLPLAAIALLPLLVASAKETSPWRRFVGGFLAGLIFFAGSCYWIYGVQREHGGLSVAGASGIFALFCFVLALYFGVFSWLAGYLWIPAFGPVAIPLLWVALEYARTYIISGFPWLLLGYALTDYFPIARLVRWTGVYGLSYLLVALPVACIWIFLRPGRLVTVHLAAVVAALVVLSLTARTETFDESQKAYLVQTDIPEEAGLQPWDAQTQAPLLNRLRELTVKGVGRQEPPALVIWPEVPAPFYFGTDSFTQPYAEYMARTTNSYFIIGIVGFKDPERTQSTNSLVLLEPSGSLISQYDKIHLVPFGEYVPLRRWLVIAEKITNEIGDFVPGSRVIVSDVPGGNLGSVICYEAIFPDLVRRFVQQGAGVLVNISNDGWYGSSAARYQHLLMARMRAIENARYVLRSTNTGITAVIRPDGSIAAEIPPDAPGVLQAAYAFETRQTFYTRHGDWFAMAAVAISVVALLAAWIRRPRQS